MQISVIFYLIYNVKLTFYTTKTIISFIFQNFQIFILKKISFSNVQSTKPGFLFIYLFNKHNENFNSLREKVSILGNYLILIEFLFF